MYRTRLQRKHRTDINFKNQGGMLDLFDNEVKAFLRINDEEYDYLADNMSDFEMSLFVKDSIDFNERKELLFIIEKYLKRFYK